MPAHLNLEREIDLAMRSDQFRFSRRFRALHRGRKAGGPDSVDRLADDVRRSVERRETRRLQAPKVRYELELPILERRQEIADAIAQHPVVIVSGETGSGKSTQLPKICLELGRGVAALIGHTQPRRIAARSIATRLAEELGVSLGSEVGFKTRFADATGPRTYVKLMTDGILLAESLHDRFLDQYDTIILDEAHERSLNIDFLIGYLRQILPRRKDLKLIITSATIDAERFAAHFEFAGQPAPIIEVSGRTYPVETRYRPLEPDDQTGETDLQEAVLDAVKELWEGTRGDILVFMPTERDIHETSRSLRGALARGEIRPQDTEILPLYARLSDRDHARIFQPHGRPRIVIATNVAESSLTVPGIRYVIDPGTARISRYSPRTQTQRLPIEAVSRASADQRAGRCGRTAPGVCIRLYSEDDYPARDRFTMPEIQRTNLAAVILQAKALRLGDIETYPFIDPPKPAAVRAGYKTLFELGALDDAQGLTPLGQKLTRLPVDPRVGRMILAAEAEGSLAEVLILAAVLEGQDPRVRPHEHREAADRAHAQWADADSDFISLLRLWDFYHQIKGKLSRGQLRKACAQNFLSPNRMNEWLELHRQLVRIVGEAGLKPGPRRDDYSAIHRAVLAGLLTNIAQRGETHDYNAAGGRKCFLWPGSGLFQKKPKWIVAAESVETSQRFLRTCGRVDPAWIEPLAEHLVERTYSDPQWERRSGSAIAFERVSLMGLVIVPRRRVSLGPIDPERARELMIETGLVEGEIDLKADFFVHNQRLRAEVESWQKKLRRLDLFLGDPACYAFYDRVLPAEVHDVAGLNRWLRGLTAEEQRRLCLTPDDLLRDEVDAKIDERFPNDLPAGRIQLPLTYEFAPGETDDGVTITVPVEGFAQLDERRLSWLVPGWLEQKVAAMIKSLPKPLRKQLVPAPDVARRVAPALKFGHGSLAEQLAPLLSRLAGEPIPADAFESDKMAPELRMNVRVVDSEGKTLAEGRDLGELRLELGAEEQTADLLAEKDSPWHRDGLTTWDFEMLPEEIEIRRQGIPLRAYPALLDQETAVGLRLVGSPHQAERLSRKGVRRLAWLVLKDSLVRQVEWFPEWKQWRLWATLLGEKDLKGQLALLLADRAMIGDQPLPRTQADFKHRLKLAKQGAAAAVQDVIGVVGPVLKIYHQAQLLIEKLDGTRWQAGVDDVRAQLAALMPERFLTSTPWAWLRHFPRYLQAVCERLERLPSDSARDRQHAAAVAHWWQRCSSRQAGQGGIAGFDPELETLRWMIEEYRVSLFAQRLGTSMPVSEKRLERQWEKLEV